MVTYKPSPAEVKTLLEAGTSVELAAGSTVAAAAYEDTISVLAAPHPLRQAIPVAGLLHLRNSPESGASVPVIM